MTMQIRTAVGNSRKREANQVFRRYQSSGNDRIVQTQTRAALGRYVGARMRFQSGSCFIRAEALTRLARVTLQVRLHLRTNAWTEGTPTSSSWLRNRGGWYPKHHWKGDILEEEEEEEEVWLLMAFSAYSN